MQTALGVTGHEKSGVMGHEKPKTPLGMAGFPYKLSPMKTKTALPIPPVNFTEAAPSHKKIFSDHMKIYMTPDRYL